MRGFRKEDLSLHHYLRFNILNDFIETDSNVPLDYSLNNNGNVYKSASNRRPSPISNGRGWVYLNNYGDVVEQQSMVTVYSGTGTVISGTEYTINYIGGEVVTSGTIIPAAVKYKYFYVSLVEEWDMVESGKLPVVVVGFDSFFKEGFQLGGGQLVPRRGHLDIFASSRAERSDLMELLYNGLYQKCCPNQSWTSGGMLNWDGTFNKDYVYETAQYQSSLQFDNVTAKTVKLPLLNSIPNNNVLFLDDVNRYRARINFDMFHYVNA